MEKEVFRQFKVHCRAYRVSGVGASDLRAVESSMVLIAARISEVEAFCWAL